MNRLFRRRNDARPTVRPDRRPTFEGLEDRLLMATSDGGQWTYGSRITYSFMPDGTSFGGTPSSLFQTLNARFSTATWEQAFEKAAGVWQAVANINLALVPDNGLPVGTAGNQQDDPRFGDIRIGAIPLSPGTLAETLLPPPVNTSTDSGDIFLNSTISWQINTDYDLETVAIHELGHALGLGHSLTAAADMYASYTGMKQTLNSDDTSGIQTIYGPAPADTVNNGTSTAATDLTPLLNSQAQAMLSGPSIANGSDLDWFKVTVPANSTGTMVVSMQATNLSTLSPRVAVYNGTSGTLVSLGQGAIANNFGGTVTFTVNCVTPGQVYYFRASTANSGPGSNGAYGMGVNFGTSAQTPATPPNTVVVGAFSSSTNFSPLSTGNGVVVHHGRHHRSSLLHDQPDTIKIGNTKVYGDALTIGRAGPRPSTFH